MQAKLISKALSAAAAMILVLSGCVSGPKEYYPIAGADIKQDKQSAIWHCSLVAEQAAERVRVTGNDNFSPQASYAYTANTQCNGNAYNANCTTTGEIYDNSNYAGQKAGNDFAVGFMAGMKEAKTMSECMAFNGYTD